MTTASESCESTGQMSLFGETCERSTVPVLPALWPTPVAKDDNKSLPAYIAMRERYGQTANVSSLNVMIKAGLSPSSPQAIPASHSHSPGSDWARKMTATYGQKLSAYWLSCDPPDSWVRTLLGTSTWASMTCYLTWKKSVTPRGRLLFRLVPSTPRTAGIASGLWGTPTSRDHKDTGNMENVPVNGLLGRQDLTTERMLPTPNAAAVSNDLELRKSGDGRATPNKLGWAVAESLLPTPRASESELRTYKRTPTQDESKHGKYLAVEAGQTQSMKLNSAWVSRMMGYPDGWLDIPTNDGEATP